MFYIGQKVVCIKGLTWAGYAKAIYPENGSIYIVRRISNNMNGEILFLGGIDNSHLVPDLFRIEPGFSASAFRPITETKSEISFTIGADPDSDKWDNRVKRRESV